MEWVGGVSRNLRCFTSHQQNKNLWQPCTKIRRSSLQWGRIYWCWINAMSKYVKCLIQIYSWSRLYLSFSWAKDYPIISLFLSPWSLGRMEQLGNLFSILWWWNSSKKASLWQSNPSIWRQSLWRRWLIWYRRSRMQQEPMPR